MNIWTVWKESINNKFPRGERHALHVTLTYALMFILVEAGANLGWATFGLIAAWVVKEILEYSLTTETFRNSINDVLQGSMILPMYFALGGELWVTAGVAGVQLVAYYLITTRRI